MKPINIKNIRVLIISTVLSVIMLLTAVCQTNRYMATDGVDAGDCTNESTPCLSLQYIFSHMNGGDTLLIEDGEYYGVGDASDNDDRISQVNAPPSGTPEKFTVIRAKNIPCQDGVPCNQPLRVRFSGNARIGVNGDGATASYVKFWGIRWNGQSITYTGWNHLYFKQVAFQGDLDGNTVAVSIGGQYNLLEDVVAFGKGRYKILFYDYSRDAQANGPGNNVCRRCIARHDWSDRDDPDGRTNIAGMCSYFNRGTAFLNCLVIDSDSTSYWSDANTTLLEIPGGFYKPLDAGPHNLTIKGSMVINCAFPVYGCDGGNGGSLEENPEILENIVGVHVAGGFFKPLTINQLTLVDVGIDNFNYRSDRQLRDMLVTNDGIRMGAYDGETSFSNLLMRDIAGTGISGLNTTDYAFIYSADEIYNANAPTNLYTDSDPFTNGLLYPTRIEEGSPLKTAGENGGQAGAQIIKKLGKDGTFKYETNWDSEQGYLWPWPLESWIQAELRTSEWGADPYRGFCSQGLGLYGGPITLTSYIWEQFGNPCPMEVLTSMNEHTNSLLSSGISLYQNFPNPFNTTTTISYELPKPGMINLTIYDILGRKVTTLVNEIQEAGIHTVQWNGATSQGNQVSSGIYNYQMIGEHGKIKYQHMVYLK